MIYKIAGNKGKEKFEPFIFHLKNVVTCHHLIDFLARVKELFLYKKSRTISITQIREKKIYVIKKTAKTVVFYACLFLPSQLCLCYSYRPCQSPYLALHIGSL